MEHAFSENDSRPPCAKHDSYSFAGPNVRLNDEIALNIGPGETLVGIEVLDAKQVLGQGKLPSVELENVPVLSDP